jgi:hypothetical protein
VPNSAPWYAPAWAGFSKAVEGGMFMSLEKSCKFYQDSKCILEGGYCDLDCNRLMSDEDFRFYDKIDALTHWQTEELEKQIGGSGSRLK